MPGVDLGITLPTVGVTAGPTYATDINTALQTIIDDIEDKVVLSEIDVTQNWSFRKDGTSYAITDMDYVEFEPVSVDPNKTGIVYVKDVSGVIELWYDDGTNSPFALTSGGILNAASLAGFTTTGIPAYGASGVECQWVAASTRYDFKAGSGADDMASIGVSEVELRDGGDSLTLDVDTLSGNVTWTLPADLPASDEGLLKIDSSGNVDHAAALTPEGGTLAITGVLTATSLTVTGGGGSFTGAVTCSSLTRTSNYDVRYGGAGWTPGDAAAGVTESTTNVLGVGTTAQQILWLEGLADGQKIKSISVTCQDDTGANEFLRFELVRMLNGSITPGVVGASWDSANNGLLQTAITSQTVSLASNYTYGIRSTPQAGTFTWTLSGVILTLGF